MNLTVKSKTRDELIDITREVQERITQAGIAEGLCILYVPHTTAAVTINEGADPTVKADILMMLDQVIPWTAGYRHREGNSAAHIKSSFIGASETILIQQGQLVLGTWQSIFFCEFDGPRTRRVNMRLIEDEFKE